MKNNKVFQFHSLTREVQCQHTIISMVLLDAVAGLLLGIGLQHLALSPALTLWLSCGLGFTVVFLLRLVCGCYSFRRLRPEGAVFVTGCDSGMGEETALKLVGEGYDVFAGCYSEASFEKLREKCRERNRKVGDKKLHPVQIDVTSDSSVQEAVALVREQVQERGLIGVINCAGLGYCGPCEYFPLDLYEKQIQVNLIGYIRVTQAFMPLVREATSVKGSRQGRLIFIGTGGGVPSACPPLLSAYMASKWGGDAFCQSLRIEMQLRKYNIDACLINPGFIKPTQLASVGERLLQETWKKMPPQASEEYKEWVDKFLKFSEEQPGTHVSKIGEAMVEAMSAPKPLLRYRVGFDSKASPIVGLLPTSWREWILRKSMFNAP